MKNPVILALLVALLSTQVYAKEAKAAAPEAGKKIEIDAMVGYTMGGGLGLGASYNYGLNENFGVEGSLLYTSGNTFDATLTNLISYNTFVINALGTFTFDPSQFNIMLKNQAVVLKAGAALRTSANYFLPAGLGLQIGVSYLYTLKNKAVVGLNYYLDMYSVSYRFAF